MHAIIFFLDQGQFTNDHVCFFKENECLRISIPVKNVESFLRLSNLHRHQI